MATMSIGDCISIDDGPVSMSRWQPYQLEFNSEGYLYATPADKLVKVNTADLTYEKIADDVFDMALFEGSQGTAIYTLKQKDTVINVINKQPEVVKPELVDGYYQIKSFDDFLYTENEPTAKYKLMNDITVGTTDAPFTTPFEFSGEFDGNGNTIDVNIQAEGSAGLFSSQPTYNGKVTIKNLTLTGSVTRTDVAAANTTINGSVGAFIGYTENQTVLTIENCINKASVNGGAAGYHVGGIVGRVCGVQDSVIKNTKNYGNVTASQGAAQVGGLAGMYSGTITESVNGGNVTKTATSNYYTGGLVGEAVKGMLLEKSANFGNVTAVTAGGLVGSVTDLNTTSGVKSFTIENSFNAGTVTGSTAASGVLCNRISVPLILTNVYNAGVVSGARTRIFVCYGNDADITPTNLWYDVNYTAAGVGSTGYSMFSSSKNTLELIGFDSSIWTWDTSVCAYPYITSVGVIATGTDSVPYQIKTKEDFMAIRNNPTATYCLVNDIDLGSYEPFAFKGHLIGKVKDNGEYPTINVDINLPDKVKVGLFSQIEGLVRIENIKVTGSITAGGIAGGFAGVVSNMFGETDTLTQGSYIKNCINDADITVVDIATEKQAGLSDREKEQVGRSAGGFVGYFRLGTGRNIAFTNLLNTGDISAAKSYVGGIVGNLHGILTNCVNKGTIFGDNCIGGLAGFGYDAREIKGSYNAGNVIGREAVGGLVGRWEHAGTYNVIVNSYNIGDITAIDKDYTDMVGTIIGNVIGNGAANLNGVYNAGSINGNYLNKPCGEVATTGTYTNVISLTVDGDADSDAQTLGIAGLEAVTTELGEGFTVSATDYKFPQIAGNINNEALELVMLDKLTLDVQEDGSVTASADIATNLTGKSVMFMLGIYNGDKLVRTDSDIKTIDKNSTSFECTQTLQEGETVKLLVWDNNMTPYCDPTVYPVVEDEEPEA